MKRRAANILDAIRDKHLFAPWFKKSDTWRAWFAFLTALFALPMTPEQLAIYQQCTGRSEAPSSPATEAWLVCGRRAGKSFILAMVAVFLATFYDYRQYLAPGERGTLLVIAQDRKQARAIMRFIRGFLTQVPMLRHMVEREQAEAFDLSNCVTVEVGTASFRSTRGYTIVAALLDEVAFWRSDEGSANLDVEVLNAIQPGMATIPNAMLLCASSPHARSGILWDAHRRHYGQNGDPILVWQAATRVMNSTVPQRVIDAKMEEDPARAAAEYGAQFRSDVESLFTREVIEAAIVSGRYELPFASGATYHAYVDPSGGSSDSMTVAIAHMDRKTRNVVLDAVRERRPPFSPDAVAKEFAELIRSYGLHKVRGDRYGGEWPRERFRAHGVTYELSELTASDTYQALLPVVNGRRAELLDHPRLTAQLITLERSAARSGRDMISHPKGSHDDIANAVAGSIVLADAKRPLIVSPTVLQRARQPVFGRRRSMGVRIST